jgi:monofunctional biosynthetic peptidoglycan transglycosylase
LAVITAEDQKFLHHHGFDFESIKQARAEYLAGERLRGASTISQQVAKNLFLWNRKSWIRKGLEAYYTVLLELLLPKKRILEIYLNIAEFSDGIFGINPASKMLFKKSPDQLNPKECALLAAVLPNPKRFKIASPSYYVKSRTSWILVQMNQLGGISILDDL